MDDYIERILSKDVTESAGIAHPDRLSILLQAIAAAPATELVTRRYARDLDIPARTIPRYLKGLTGAFQVTALPAWGHNLGKRAIGKPKVFLSDTGLSAHLAGVDAKGLEERISDPFTSGLLESFVALELLKQKGWSAIDYKVFHWRDRNGPEVDLVLESRNRQIVGIQVKATTSPRREYFRDLETLKTMSGDRFVNGILLYTGKHVIPFGPNLWALPISSLWS